MSFKTKFNIASLALPATMLIYGLSAKRYNIAYDSLLTVFCITAFIIILKKVPVLKTATYFAVIIFILLSVFAGRCLGAYSLIPHWDKILHFTSGFIIASAGKQIYATQNSTENKRFMLLFALIFAIAAAGLWEIYEFSIDNIFGTTAQNGSLNDTMYDMLAGTSSGAIWSAASYFKRN